MSVRTTAGRQRRMLRRERVTIRTPEQTPEQRLMERRAKLLEQAQTGQQAEAAIKFADEVLADAEDYALAQLADKTADLAAVRSDYIAALAFNQKIKAIAALGKDADRKLAKLKEGGHNAK